MADDIKKGQGYQEGSKNGYQGGDKKSTSSDQSRNQSKIGSNWEKSKSEEHNKKHHGGGACNCE